MTAPLSDSPDSPVSNPSVHLGDAVNLTVGPVSAASVRNRRDSQQDAFLVTTTVCAVADGMGGHADGARAATVALEALAAASPDVSTARGLAQAVKLADDAVCELADAAWRNPGTTLVAAVVDEHADAVHGVWVGDSRAYLVDAAGNVTCLTDDHTDHFGALVRALGDHGRLVFASPGHFTVSVGHGHRLLLCTDGVSGPADRLVGCGEDTIAELLTHGVDHLVRTTAEHGSDNATALLIDVDAFAAGR
jgi:protein phosphatase